MILIDVDEFSAWTGLPRGRILREAAAERRRLPAPAEHLPDGRPLWRAEHVVGYAEAERLARSAKGKKPTHGARA